MKIVHVIPVLACGGAEILAGQLALQQKKMGCEVVIVTLRNFHESFDHYPEKEKLLQEIPITVIRSRVRLAKGLVKQRNLGDWELFLEQFKPDVIHAHLYEADFLAHAVIKKNVSYVTHIHGSIPQLLKKKSLPLSKKQLQVWFERQWLHQRYRRSQTHFIVPSRSIYDYANQIIPASLQANVHLLNNAINLASFPFIKRNKISQPVRMITVGNLLAIKNHDFLIRVLKMLRNDGLDCQLDILGGGVKEPSLLDLIDSLHLKGKVHLRGSVGNVNTYLSHADIYLHASIPEAFGLAVAEAMSNGLPVIALDGGGTADLVHDGVNGYLLKEKNTELFANKIKLLLKDHLLYQNMSLQSGKMAAKFDIQNYSFRIVQIYEKIISEN